MTPETLARIHADCFTSPPPWSVWSFAEILGDTHVTLLDDHQDRGFALARVVGDEAELLTLAIVPRFRRMGIARDLLGWFDRYLPTLGARRAFLEVAEDNAPACALYEACGWVQNGRRPGYYVGEGGKRIAALILCKSLGPVLP